MFKNNVSDYSKNYFSTFYIQCKFSTIQHIIKQAKKKIYSKAAKSVQNDINKNVQLQKPI